MNHIRPNEEALSEPFWRNIQAGRLTLQRCAHCKQYRHPPTPICANCLSFDDEWVEASGRGMIYTFTVVHHSVHPALDAKVPYVVALVELEEGVRIVSNLALDEGVEPRIGMKVQCRIEPLAPDFRIPVFRCDEP